MTVLGHATKSVSESATRNIQLEEEHLQVFRPFQRPVKIESGLGKTQSSKLTQE